MNINISKLSQIFPSLPPRSFNDCTEKVHPLTSLHRAVWNYQETAATSSVDLAKKVKTLSEQKIAAYEGRLGFVLEWFSGLINYCHSGRWISAGRLGLELADSVIAKTQEVDEDGFVDAREIHDCDEEEFVDAGEIPDDVSCDALGPVETAEPVAPLDEKFLGHMAVEFQKIWSKDEDLTFAVSCWSHLLAGVNKGRFTVLESGQRYLFELDDAVTGKMTTPLGVSVVMHLSKEIEITISKDEYGNYSFNFPKGGISSEIAHPLLPKMERTVSQIAIFSASKDAMIAVPPLEVSSWAFAFVLRKIDAARLNGNQFNLNQTLDFQDTLNKLGAFKWGE